jgi:hypothetical protein
MPRLSKKKQLEIAERRKVVAANILAGATYRDIANALNVSVGTVAGDAGAILSEWRAERVDNTDARVVLDIRRLDLALNAIFDKVQSGDVRAIETMIRIQDRAAKYLGLDAPAKVAPTDPSGTKPYEPTTNAQIAAGLAELFGLDGASAPSGHHDADAESQALAVSPGRPG